jgi:serine/threonine-protein kinase PpkA
VCVKSFNLARTELTTAEFNVFAKATSFVSDAERNHLEKGCWSYDANAKPRWQWWAWAFWRKPVQNHEVKKAEPVTCVSFRDVAAYIVWLNKETGHVYRLPTEVEWEYAARGGTNTAHYWGDNADVGCGYANIADVKGYATQAHNCADGYQFSAPVKRLHANKFGLYDMLGNVWEWTCSGYEEQYQGAETTCLATAPNEEQFIVLRGGGWNADATRVRAAHRNWGTAWTRQANLGFRLVRER